MRYLKYHDQLGHCFSAVIADVLDALGARHQCLAPTIRPLLPGMRTWGEAVTVRLEAVAEVPARPFQLEMEVLDEARPGQVIVAHCETAELSAFWGGLLTNAAMGRQLAGVITDGGVRDYSEITALGFPTFSAGLTPYDSLGRMDGRERDLPIICGGVRVCPGDLIFGDADGVVAVPQELADEVVARAWAKVNAESDVRQALRSGASVVETFRKYGVL
jgi:regulator of RNase E activity RraA